MLKMRKWDVTPPDKYQFWFVQDGFIAKAMDKDSWFLAIDKHYKDNDYQQPENWREIAEDQLCRRLSGEWCSGGDDHTFVNTRFTLDDFRRGTAVLSKFVLSADQVVSPELAESRALTCSRCVFNIPVPGCSACSGMANAVMAIKGARSTQYDPLLKACSVCKCANAAQIWVPAEYLAKGVTEDMLKTYRQIPECWKGKEIDALEN